MSSSSTNITYFDIKSLNLKYDREKVHFQGTNKSGEKLKLKVI